MTAQPKTADTDPKTDPEEDWELGNNLRQAPPTIQAAVRAARRTPAGDDEKEPLGRLIAECEAFFGISAHNAAGAFHALPAYDITELTRVQALAVIAAWSDSPAHVDPRQGDPTTV